MARLAETPGIIAPRKAVEAAIALLLPLGVAPLMAAELTAAAEPTAEDTVDSRNPPR